MPPTPPLPPAPPELQAEAEGYERACVRLTKALNKLYVLQDRNRARGLALVALLAAAGVPTIIVGDTILQPQADGRGLNRIPIDPARRREPSLGRLRPRRPGGRHGG